MMNPIRPFGFAVCAALLLSSFTVAAPAGAATEDNPDPSGESATTAEVTPPDSDSEFPLDSQQSNETPNVVPDIPLRGDDNPKEDNRDDVGEPSPPAESGSPLAPTGQEMEVPPSGNCPLTIQAAEYRPNLSAPKRLHGSDRYATATAISSAVHPQAGANLVVIASGTAFPDALASSALAAYAGAPVLLVQPRALPTSTRNELKRLKPSNVIIIGGTSAISTSVHNAIASLPEVSQVDRIGGKDRYATTDLVSQCFPKGQPVTIATGATFPDATVGGAVAAKVGGPILLTPGFTSSATVESTLKRLEPSDATIVGGTWSQQSLTRLKNAAGTAQMPTVVSGRDRYATSVSVANRFWPQGSAQHAITAVGTNFSDALAGVTAAKAFNAPTILTAGGCRPAGVRRDIVEGSKLWLLGGPNVVSDYALTNQCITNSDRTVSSTFRGGTYSFNIGRVSQYRDGVCVVAASEMVLRRMGYGKNLPGFQLQYLLEKPEYFNAKGYTDWPSGRMPSGVSKYTGGKVNYSKLSHPTEAQLHDLLISSFVRTGRPIVAHLGVYAGEKDIYGRVSRGWTHGLAINSYNPQTRKVQLLDPAGGVAWPGGPRSHVISLTRLKELTQRLGVYY